MEAVRCPVCNAIVPRGLARCGQCGCSWFEDSRSLKELMVEARRQYEKRRDWGLDRLNQGQEIMVVNRTEPKRKP